MLVNKEYKDSGVSWLGNIPALWNIVKTKRHFQNEKRVAGKYANQYERLALTMNGVIKRDKEDAEGLQPESFEGYQVLEQNQLVFKLIDLENVKTSRVGLSPYTGIVSPAYIILHNDQQDNRFYYYYYMNMYYQEIFNYLGGEGVRSALNAKDLLETPIPDISLKQQKVIADYLDKECARIDDIVEKQRNIIEKLKEYKKSVITEAVTKGLNPDAKMKDSDIEWIGEIPEHWEIRRIKTLGEYRNGLTYNPENMAAPEEGMLVLRSSNVQNGQLVFEDNVFVNCAIPEQLFVHKGDIIICSRNGSRELVGKNAIVKEDIHASFGAFMMVFRSKYAEYISYVLNSAIFNYYLSSFFTSTINQLTGGNFGNMRIVFCPDEKERAEITTYLDKKVAEIDSVVEKREKIIDLLIEYKKSIIYECVTGKKEVA